MAGRKRKPDSLKVLSGTDQPCRINKDAPEFSKEIPDIPEKFQGFEEIWFKLGKLLGPAGVNVITEADDFALQLLVEAYSDYVSARDFLYNASGKYQPTYETITQTGSKIERPLPQVSMAADAWRRVLTMLAEFGITPAARSRVTTLLNKDNKNPFAQNEKKYG